jgi:hypothetical protein
MENCRDELDAHAKLGGLGLAGLGVEIVRGAVPELVTDAEFAAYIDAKSGDGHAYRKPAKYPERRVVITGFVNGCKGCGFDVHRRQSLQA